MSMMVDGFRFWPCANNRCGIVWADLDLPISDDAADKILIDLGFRLMDTDLVHEARELVGRAEHVRGARPSQAPAVIDCSSLVQWVYRQCGILLPRYSIHQRQLSYQVDCSFESLYELRSGDIVFRSGWRPYFWSDLSDGIGHAGIATGQGTVIHAPNRGQGVVEEPMEAFYGDGTKWRGASRIVSDIDRLRVYAVPHDREIMWNIDIRCLVLQSIR